MIAADVDRASPVFVHADGHCQRVLREAEAELSAFLLAVRDLFGNNVIPEAAEFWLQELECLELSRNTRWRLLTIAAASRVIRSNGSFRYMPEDSQLETSDRPLRERVPASFSGGTDAYLP